MKVKDIIKTLEQWVPLQFQEHYDNAGLIVGDTNQIVSSILVSLDVTEEVVQEAITKKCNLIVAHHPFIFKGVKKITPTHWINRTLILAIKNDISIYISHTNLDSINTGVNKKICDIIGIQSPKILSPKKDSLSKLVTFVPTENKDKVLQALYDAGAGKIGNYDHCSFSLQGQGSFRPNDLANPHIGKANETEKVNETRIEVLIPSHLESKILNSLKNAHPYEEVAYYLMPLKNENQEVGAGMYGQLNEEIDTIDFLKLIKEKFSLKTLKHTKLIYPKIKTVAVCGGSGFFLLNEAKNTQSQLFITSDIKYHDFFEANNEIILIDIGHYESEYFTIELINNFITEKCSNFAVVLSKVNTNPINYF